MLLHDVEPGLMSVSSGTPLVSNDRVIRDVPGLQLEEAVPIKIPTHYLADDDIAALTRRAEQIRGRSLEAHGEVGLYGRSEK
jgi:hypothetical protein